MNLAPLDELRALPPSLVRVVLEQMAREHGAEAVAALRWQVNAHRRPVQRIPSLEELAAITVITGEYGTGKTQFASWITLEAIRAWKVERPRIVAATRETVRDTVVDGPSGLLAWLPPWVPRTWQSSTGHAGLLRVDGIEVSCLSADAGAQAIGSGSGWVLFDDYAKCAEVLGARQAEAALVAAFKSLREWPGRMLLPTTPDGAAMIQELASAEGIRGVEVWDLGATEDNRGNLAASYVNAIVPNLRALNRWLRSAEGAFSEIDWVRLRVREVPRLVRVIVFIDPAKSQRSHACKVGIVAVGIDATGTIYGLVDRSDRRLPDGPDGWPAVATTLAEEMERRFGIRCEMGIECNTLGRSGPEHLRAEEKLRNAAAGRPAISTRTIHEVTSKPNEPKTRRAAPVVALAKGGQVRMVAGLGELETSLSGLTDGGAGSDPADAFVHGARELAGLSEDGVEVIDHRKMFEGLEEAFEAMPRPTFAAPELDEATDEYRDWERV